MINNFVVYIHYRKSDNLPFYVGEGRLERSRNFRQRNSYWLNTFKKHGCYIKIVVTNLSKKESTRLESKIIKGFRKSGYPLTNILDSTISYYSRSNGNPKLAQWNKEHSGIKSLVYNLKRLDLIERNKNGTFNRFSKRIKCIELNKEFSSIRQANLELGKKINSSEISKYLGGDRKHAFGYQWTLI